MTGWKLRSEWDKNSCIEAVEQYIALLRRLPKLDEEGANHLPALQVFELEVGVAYQKYCDIVHPELSRIGHSPPSKLTAEDIFKLTDAFYEKHHRRPRAEEYRSHNHLPSHNTILAATGLTASKFWDKFYPDTIAPQKESNGEERQKKESHTSTAIPATDLSQEHGDTCEVMCETEQQEPTGPTGPIMQ